jgi:hypothetical protein
MIAFIDEAGDTGFKLNQGSSEFFIITLVIFDQNDEAAACDQRITLLRRELGLAADFEFHFNETPDFLKRLFFKAIVPYNFFYVTTIIAKKNLYQEAFKYPNAFYKYACNLVFDNARQYLERAIVVFDGSGSQRFRRELATFLRKNLNSETFIRVQKVKIQDSKRTNLIQLVDMVCGAVALSLKSPKERFWEYRRLIGHRELLTKIWPPPMFVEKDET